MKRLELSRAADGDLDQLLTWGRRTFGDDLATAYYFGFEDSFALLQDYPQAGQIYEDGDGGFRVLKYRSHRIFYLVEPDRIFIVRILHSAMDVSAALN